MHRLDPKTLPDGSFTNGTWALIDAEAAPRPPPAELVHINRAHRFFVVLAASPQQTRYKEFAKQRTAPRIWMKPWAWDEIWAGCVVSTSTGINKRCSWMIRSSFNNIEAKANAPRLRELFSRYGGTARVVYQSCIEVVAEMNANGVRDAILGMKLEDLQSFLTKSVEDSWTDSTSSRLFIVRPAPDSRIAAQYDVASDYILKLLMEKFAAVFDAFQSIMIQMLKAVDKAAAVRGMLFEVSAHGKLMKGPVTLSMMEMELTKNPSNWKFWISPNTSGRPKELRLQTRKLVHFGNDDEELSSISFDTANYYVPRAANNATFDSFLVCDQELYVFQFTVGQSHDAKKKGLEMLKKIVGKKVFRAHNFVCVVPEKQTVDLLIPKDDAVRFQNFFKFYHLRLPV